MRGSQDEREPQCIFMQNKGVPWSCPCRKTLAWADHRIYGRRRSRGTGCAVLGACGSPRTISCASA